MKITTILSTILLICFSSNSMACKCVMPGPTIEESVQRSDYIFIGKCIAGEFLEEGNILSPKNYSYKVVWTFEIQKKLKGEYLSDTIKVETGVGSGDCGFPFVFGFSFLVYGKHLDDRIGTDICSRTKIAGVYPIRLDDEAQKELDMVVSLCADKPSVR